MGRRPTEFRPKTLASEGARDSQGDFLSRPLPLPHFHIRAFMNSRHCQPGHERERGGLATAPGGLSSIIKHTEHQKEEVVITWWYASLAHAHGTRSARTHAGVHPVRRVGNGSVGDSCSWRSRGECSCDGRMWKMLNNYILESVPQPLTFMSG